VQGGGVAGAEGGLLQHGGLGSTRYGQAGWEAGVTGIDTRAMLRCGDSQE
jgi:hypothetical protein